MIEKFRIIHENDQCVIRLDDSNSHELRIYVHHKTQNGEQDPIGYWLGSNSLIFEYLEYDE